ncbi:YceI family protein [Paraburkholderia panacisoli]|uniref:YceI family protein n=1 Tax=Paraburkholderia panacisoli TaxID=2603818 RepID=UPI001FEC6371|nr:YceI family protein [Paraburkholderia panacisoli]
MNGRYLCACAAACAALSITAQAVEVTYKLDPTHTYPSFEADHYNGVSIWRGKFNKSSGVMLLDRARQSGALDVTIDMSSVDTGNHQLDDILRSKTVFDVDSYPVATYKSTEVVFKGDVPVAVLGNLTLHGVTMPVELKIQSFKCIESPLLKKEVCGTESTAVFDRSDFGLAIAKDHGFNMNTTLHIQAEGIKQ